MAKMPELVELHENAKDEGLVVIGINFDEDADKAREAIADKGLAWPQVHAKTAAKGRDDLWGRMAGISTLPRVLFVDREGILRADVYPHDLKGEAEKLLEAR